MLQLDMYVYIEMQFILSHNAPSHISIVQQWWNVQP